MATSRDGGKTKGMSRSSRDNVQPVNGGKGNGNVPQLASAASHGSGNKGSLSSLTRKTHKGSGNRGTLKSLVSGTKKTGKSPFPSMGKGPLR